MPAPSNDAWLVPDADRLVVIPDIGEAWAVDYEASVFRFGGSEYRNPQYASEWFALTTSSNDRTPAGIFFDMVMFAELTQWLSRGFANVRRVGENAFHIIFTENRNLDEPGWPFLPCEAFRNDANQYAIWIPSYYQMA